MSRAAVEALGRPLRFACAGGAPGTFIGDQHRDAVRHFGGEIVAGCFSRDSKRSLAAGSKIGVSENRTYGSVSEMIAREAELPETERPDAVIICTFNSHHAPQAIQAVECGFNVVIDKPMTHSLETAETLQAKIAEHEAVCLVTYSYSGVPAIRAIAEKVRCGEIGQLLSVAGTYLQSWMGPVEGVLPEERQSDEPPAPQARWRVDPAHSGRSMTFFDIGLHAFDCLFDVSGLTPDRVRASLRSSVESRILEDHGWAIVETREGVDVHIQASQVFHGAGNDFSIRLNGTSGSYEWAWDTKEQYTHGLDHERATTTLNWAGHQFFPLYEGAMAAMSMRAMGNSTWRDQITFPDVTRGVSGVRFVERCLESSENDGAPVAW